MLNITHYQKNANQGHNEVPFHTSQNGCDSSLQAINAGEDVEKREPSYTVGENINLCGHYGRQHRDSSKS